MENKYGKNIYYLLNQMKGQETRNQQYKSILLKNFDVKTKLGGGSFGVAYQAEKLFHSGNSHDTIDFDTGESFGFQKTFAIKLIPNFTLKEGLNEIENLSGLIHPNIVRCLKAWIEEVETSDKCEWNKIKQLIPKDCSGLKRYCTSSGIEEPTTNEILRTCLFLQYKLCTHGNLAEFLAERDRNVQSITFDLANLPETINMSAQIIEGLVYLQFNGIVHGDLKPDNIFIKRKSHFVEIKIGDFGLSKSKENLDVNLDKVNENYDPRVMRRLYTAPEHLKSVFVCKGDMYSFGLILMEMLVSFPNKEKIRLMTISNAMDPLPNRKYSLKFAEIYPEQFQWITQLLSYKISDRPSALKFKNMLVRSNFYPKKIPFEKLNVVKVKECLLPLADQILRQSINESCHKILSELFYKVFPILETELATPLVFEIVRHCSIVSSMFDKDGDRNYRSLFCATFLENNLGDHEKTLEWQVRTLVTGRLSRARLGVVIDEMCREIEDKINNSSLFQKLAPTHQIKMEYEKSICDAICLNDNSSEADLQNALKTLNRLDDMYDTGMLKDEGTEGEKLTDLVIRKFRQCSILEKLRKTQNANDIYFSLIEKLCILENGALSSRTLLVMKAYINFLVLENQLAKARTYCESLCHVYDIRDIPENSLQISLALETMVKIYHKLGFEAEVDFILGCPSRFKAEFNLKYKSVMSDLAVKEALGSFDMDKYVDALRKQMGLQRKLVQINSSKGSDGFMMNNSIYGPLFKDCHPIIVFTSNVYRKFIDNNVKRNMNN